jgi:Bacterial Ig-like domain
MTILKNIQLLGLFLALSTLTNGCANIGQLNGGQKDAIPPRVLTTRSTPNFQTNFKKQPIKLVFDEYIKLDDVFKQVVISPPLDEVPEVVSKDSRSVILTFGKDVVLRENATYTINFGTAVKDLNEGNVAKNLRFVFSTGDHIDSLTVVGRIVDAVSGQPVEGALMMLYDNISDTIVRKKKPFYFGRTEKDGIARIENVREGSFKAFALVDKDQNYLFNQDVERIGFPDTLINVSLINNSPQLFPPDTSTKRTDGLQNTSQITENKPKNTPKDTTASPSNVKRQTSNLTIRLFDPLKKPQLMNRETDKFGLVKLTYNQELTAAKINYDQIGQTVQTEVSKDTLLVYYDLSQETAWNLVVKNDTFPNDSVRVRTKGRADFLKKAKLEAINAPKQINKHPTKPIVLAFTYPLQKIDTALIELLDSAKKTVPLSIKRDSASPRKIQFNADWQQGKRYTLRILPNALTDMYGLKNDTVSINVSVQLKEEFGDLTLKITQLDSTKNYVCQVYGGGGVVEKELYIEQKSKFNARIETIQPDGYTIKIIEDLNKNRRWDTGNYDKHTQPERIFLKTAESLRANWEVEVEVVVQFKEE